jgi:hypothetical protein
MGLSGPSMIGFADDLTPIDDDRTHHRIRAGLPFPPSSQGKGTLHVQMIRWDGGHRHFEEVEDFLRGADFVTDFFFTVGFLAVTFLVAVFFVVVFFLATGLDDLTVSVCLVLTIFFAER